MHTRAFLELLLPATGILFTATPAPVGWYNVAHESIDSAIHHVNLLTFEGRPAYFAMASYEKKKYWDDSARNQDGTHGRWRSRTQPNAKLIKSFYLDLDVEPGNPLKFDSKEHALTELRAFTKKVGLPRPMIVDSGGGIHAYWPLAAEVSTADWHPVAEQLKAICVHEGFHADRSLTSDHARVLRALGSYNTRRGAPVVLLSESGTFSFADIKHRIEDYAHGHGIPLVAATSRHDALPGAGAAIILGDNLGATNDPLNFDRIAFHCSQIGGQTATRGASTGEQLWRATLGVVKFCEPQDLAIRAVSDGHPDFDLGTAQTKIVNWSTGPTKCAHFHELNPQTCEACPHWQKLTSPAQLGRQVVQAPAPEVQVATPTGITSVTLPTPPTGYSRRSDGAVCRESEDKDGKVHHDVVCPYDLYPLTIRSQMSEDTEVDERSVWRVHLPIKAGEPPAARDFDLPLGMLPDLRALSKHLSSKGIVLSGDQIKMTQHYMSAYLQKLAKEAGRASLYERLGWYDDHQSFVLGDRILHRDGTATAHPPSDAVKAVTKGMLKSAGTLAGWQAAMQFYNKPGYEGHRFFIYASLASPLFHMNDTGNKGAVLCASGASGRGKTTCLKACSSVWGSPESLVTNGNKEGATTNALYSVMGTVHSLPFILDEVTERESDELRRLFLNVSQGEGKRRMGVDGVMKGKLDTWANLSLLSTNADTIAGIMGTGKDVEPHLMRLVNVEFAAVNTDAEGKIAADHFIRNLGQHYGHLGPIFMGIVIKEYEAIRRLYIRNVEKIDRMLASSNASAERYWSAVVAACFTAAQIASKAGLLAFPYEQDLQWMVGLLARQRETIRESTATPQELLVQFLDNYQRNTLVVSARNASNLDNVVHRPSDALLVRVEADGQYIFISRPAIMEWCTTARMPFRWFEMQLESAGVIVKRNAQKTLGADTIYSRGQSRCWQVDATKLGGYTAPIQPATAYALNVVPLAGKRSA